MDQSETSSPPSSLPCRHCGEPHPPSFSHCPQTGRSLTSGRALVGRVIADRYKILALLGEGGMGAVYVAEHLLVGRKVAVKRLHPELAGDEKAIARLAREARAAGATGHEHVVEILDLGFADDGAPYLVMEYLRGESLASLLAAESMLEPARACRIAGQVLAALDAVHGRGIVHRDLKPDNIILTRRRGDPDFVKVVDFGISKVRPNEGEPAMDLTRTGVMLGTPFYMSPEQARGSKQLDHRLDLFAVGVILYEALAGRLPFEGENYHQLLQCILTGKHPSLPSLRVGLDPELVAVIEKAIALEPDDRFQTARQMLLALVPHGAVDPGPAPAAKSPAEPAARPSGLVTTARAPQMPSSGPASASGAPSGARARLSTTPMPRGLAARPRQMASAARYFVAQSPSWTAPVAPSRPPPAPPVTPVVVSAAEASPVAIAERPTLSETQSDVRGEGTAVKGSWVLSAMDFLRELEPPADDRVLARLDSEREHRIREVRLPMAWLALEDYAALLAQAERDQGASEGALAVRMGKATAERELTTTHRLFMRTATPELAIQRLPRLFRSYHSTGELAVERSTGGYRLRVDGVDPDTLAHALFFSGFCQRLLELTGAEDVRSSVVACRERGDDATITALRWR